MITRQYIGGLQEQLGLQTELQPWDIVAALPKILEEQIRTLGEEYSVTGGIAIHSSALVDPSAILKPPVIIQADTYVGAAACLRGGVFLGKGASVGHGAEIKCSVIMPRSAAAHFNFIGDSLIGSDVNFEAGSIVANHFNERSDKNIRVIHEGQIMETHVDKFGALVGDGSRIGANAVLSPGTLLPKNTIVRRLELVEQIIID
jgi:NDP-sugar pyrophosphorylase family protein